MFYRYKAKDEDIQVRGLVFTKEWRYSNIRLPLSTEEEGLLVIETGMNREALEKSEGAAVEVAAPVEKKGKKGKKDADNATPPDNGGEAATEPAASPADATPPADPAPAAE